MSSAPAEHGPADAPADTPAERPDHPLATRFDPAEHHLGLRVWDDGVVLVTLAQPDRRNAMSDRMTAAWSSAMAALREDRAVRAVVVTGAGSAFCSGGDTKPVIAAVNGFALGGGCELALACHLRVASTHAKFGLPEVKLGLIPGYGGTQRLPRLIGQGRALQLILTGEAIDAETAHRIGLANEVVSGEMLLEAARSLAKMMVAQGPLALAHAIAAVTAGAALELDAALALEATHFDAVGRTADMREGTTAFLAKRAPAFRGA